MSATKRELYGALNAILPFAEIEIGYLVDCAKCYPEDEDADPVRAKQGQDALDAARRLLTDWENRQPKRQVLTQEERDRRSQRMKGLWEAGKMRP